MATWAPMRGAWASSTRSELAGLVVAMGTNIAIHVGIDNAAVVNKSTKLIEKARSCEAEGRPYPKNPLKNRLGCKVMGIYGVSFGRS